MIAYAESAKERLALLEASEADEEQLAADAAAAQQAALDAAARLGEARRRLAPEFAARVAAELQDLAMPHAAFEVRLTPRADDADDLEARFAALGPRGADEVEFYFSANPGVPPRPLRDTASGGELSRAMLAIRGMVTLGDDVETLIFDEVDAGIGGVTAAALGERLARLAAQRQIVCITHLPQVAAHADRQFAIVKETDAKAGVTETVVTQVEGEERLAELCRMLGAAPDDAAARRHAEGLLARAARLGRAAGAAEARSRCRRPPPPVCYTCARDPWDRRSKLAPARQSERARPRPHKIPRESVAASPCRASASWWAPARRSPAGAHRLAASD